MKVLGVATPIKYDITTPSAPTLSVQPSSDNYSMSLNIKYSTLPKTGSRRWTKVYWSAASGVSSGDVHNVPETDKAVYVIESDSYNKSITFNAKDDKYNLLTVPWNTSGYFSAITYDQTYMDKYGQKNAASLQNYSTLVQTTGFYSAAEYIDISNLKIDYNINYDISDRLSVLFSFDGYEAGANISKLIITCKYPQYGNNKYYDRNGNEVISTYVEEITPPEGFSNKIKYSLPYNQGIGEYLFGFATQNAAGHNSGKSQLDTYNTKVIEEEIKKANWEPPNPSNKIYKIYGYRKRCAVHISDIQLKNESYNTVGNFISKTYLSKKPIYSVQLFTSEMYDFLTNFPKNPEVYLKYYIQFLDDKWYRISPQNRINETWIIDSDKYDENLVYVPKLLILDTNLDTDEQLKNTLAKNTAYINLTKSIYNLKIKINMDITSINNNSVSPKVTDYEIKIKTRDILKNNIIEEDISNA